MFYNVLKVKELGTTDKKFEENIKQAISHNKKIGIYAWDQSINEQEAIALANYIIGLIKPYKISLPVYIDSEAYKNSQGRADKICKEQRTKNIIAFCKTIKNGKSKNRNSQNLIINFLRLTYQKTIFIK